MSPRLIAILLVLAVGGCGTVSESKGSTKTFFKNLKLSSFQIRSLVNDYVVRFGLRIEGTADRILARFPPREVSRHALLWKINGIAAGFLAGSRTDPMAALSDLTLLALQMRKFFEDGAGTDLFGADQPLAVAVAMELEQELLEVRQLLSDDKEGLERGLKSMREFAERAPLTDLTFVRASPIKEYLASILSVDRELFSVVGDLNQSVAGLQKLVVLQAAHFPKRMRWEMELVMLDLDRSPALMSLLAELGRVAPVVDHLPATIAEERQTVLKAFTQERTESMREIGRLRDGTLDDIRQERRIVLEQVDADLEKFVRALDRLTARRVEEAMAGADGLFGRGIQIVFLGGTILAVLGLGTVFFLKRRS